MDIIHTLRNGIDYPLRRLFRWRRPGLRFKNETKQDLFSTLADEDRQWAISKAAAYREQYYLEPLYKNSSKVNYRINLYYIAMLERALDGCGCSLPEDIVAADIGPSHWFYIQGLYAVLRWWHQPFGRKVSISGYETDAYRVYGDFHSRRDHAEAHIGSLEGVEYIDYAFTCRPHGFNLITMFFPFLYKSDHLKWGLPRRHFQPSRLLMDAWESLTPGGVLIIANQGGGEKEAQTSLLHEGGLTSRYHFSFSSPFFSYPIFHYIWTVVK